MIQSFQLIKFKAFQDTEESFKNINNKNLLIYGDNGSGKSSIFEALKLALFKERILNTIIAPNQEMEEVVNTVLSREYDNKSSLNFEVILNDITIKADNNIDEYIEFNSFFLNLYSTKLTDEVEAESKRDKYKFLNIKNLIEREFLDLDINFEDFNFIENFNSKVISSVNQKLEEFKENIIIELDSGLNIKIKDEERNLLTDNIYLNLYFNEAKTNLVILLLLFETIYHFSDETKDKVLILDDVITSLDIANRTFLLKYILERFNGAKFQLIILTHNLEVYKLITFINDEILKNPKFIQGQLFEIKNQIKYIEKDFLDLKTIEQKISSNPLEAGNLIRKKFELLIHKLARELIIGSNDKADDIVKFLEKSNQIYLKKDGDNFKTANDLVFEIENIHTVGEIKNLIEEYKIAPIKIDKISNIIKNIKLYRKVIMNPLSHTEAPFAIKELYKSLDLLRKLDEMEFDIE